MNAGITEIFYRVYLYYLKKAEHNQVQIFMEADGLYDSELVSRRRLTLQFCHT